MINKRMVKEYALHVSKENRNGKFTRVSAEFYPKAVSYTHLTLPKNREV